MDTRTKTTPAWAVEYLLYAAWTQDELRNLLCGLPPVPPKDAPPRTREQINDAFVKEEGRRVVADRHLRDGILARRLKVLAPPDEQLLEKIKVHVTAEEFDSIRRAVAHERTCAKAYRVTPEAAIRWASAHRTLFPDFPFTSDDLKTAEPQQANAPVSDRLRAHRHALIKRFLDERDVTQAAFLREHRISQDTLRGVINGERRRVGPEREAQILKSLRSGQRRAP